MKYTYRKQPLPGSPRVEWTLLRDGKPVVTDIASDEGSVRKAANAAAKFFIERNQEARRVAG